MAARRRRRALAPGSPRAGRGSGRSRPRRKPVDPVAAVAERPVADRPLDDLDRRAGQERVDRRLDDPGDLGGAATSVGRPAATRHDRRHREVADRDPERARACPTTRTPAASGVEADLLGRLAQRGRADVGVVGLGLAAREAHLAASGGRRRSTARSARRRASPAGVRVDAGRAPPPAGRSAGRRAAAGAGRAADEDRHQPVGRRRQRLGQRGQPLEPRRRTRTERSRRLS